MMKEWSDPDPVPSDRWTWPIAIVLLALQFYGLAAMAYTLLR